MIQLRTASTRTEPADYWPDDAFTTELFIDERIGKERTACIATSDDLVALMHDADHENFIVELNPGLMYDHQDADVRLKVYDGYNE